VKCDVADDASLKNVVDVTVSRYGRIDCLLNNAGTHPDHRPIDNFTAEEMRNLLNINFVSYFILCKLALPHLRKVKGNIINMSSLVGVMGQSGATTYVSTKGAITAFSKALAVDEAEHGVRVNIVSPGNIWTPLWAENASDSPDPVGAVKSGSDAQLLGRMGTIAESGQLCLFIAAGATFHTGVDFLISGGAELSYGKKDENRIHNT